jgi:hypothetical protein
MTNHQALEAFLIDNPELEELESLLDEFNIFEAIGAVRQEVRHSDFLAFLLSPQEKHGLGDLFAKTLLQKAVQQVCDQELDVTSVDLALWDLDQLTVQREWRHIDILLRDDHHRLAVIIENKVDSIEHSQQLRRYWQTASRQFPDWNILGLYLTPDLREPSDDRYIPVDYVLVESVIEGLVASRASVIGPDVLTLMRHYRQLLRRHIMPDSDIAQLCQRIYRKHQRALDLIYEHRPDLQAELRDYLLELIAGTPGMILDHSTKTWVRFVPESWEATPLRNGQGWVPSNRMLLFEFGNGPDRLHLKLTIGPGPQEIRERLFNMAMKHIPPFVIGKKRGASLRGKHKAVYVRDFLRQQDYEGAALEDLTPKIRKAWTRFLDRELPRFTEVIKAETWLWTESD